MKNKVLGANVEGYFNPHTMGNVVHIVGVGATGSFLCQQIARMGVETIHIYDDDHIEEHNINNQAYGVRDIGRMKVEACAQITNSMVMYEDPSDDNPPVVIPHERRVNTKDDLELVKGKSFTVFLLVDNMESRISMVESLELALDCREVIETGLGVGNYDVRIVRPQQGYTHWLEQMKLLSAEADQPDFDEVSACGAPFATSHIAEMCAGHASSVYMETCRPDTYVFDTISHDVRGCMVIASKEA